MEEKLRRVLDESWCDLANVLLHPRRPLGLGRLVDRQEGARSFWQLTDANARASNRGFATAVAAMALAQLE